MPLVGPNTTNALSAGFQGQDLAEQMRMRIMARQQQEQAMRDADQQRAAHALMGQVLQQMMGSQDQGSAIPLLAGDNGNMSPGPPGTIPAPPQPPAAPQAPPQGSVPAPMQMPGQPQADIPTQMQQRALQKPAPAQQPAGQSGRVVDDLPEPSGPPITWPMVTATLQKVAPNAPPGVIASMMEKLAPIVQASSEERYKAWKAKQDLDLKDQTRLDRLFTIQQQLDYRYATTQSAEEKTAIQQQRMANQLEIAKITGTSRETTAGINVAGRQGVADTKATNALDVAGLKAQSQQIIADHRAQSQERMAADALALKKDLGEAANKLKGDSLDIKADEIAKTAIYRERVLDLREKGLDQQAAANQAKLDMTPALATMRDGTTRRGQDMISADKAKAAAGKLDLLRGKAAVGAEGVVSRLDDLAASVKNVLEMPGFDQATGTIAGAVPSVRQDSVNFDAALDSLRSEKGLAVIQAMREASATGGSGFSRVTNFELQQFQNSIGSLKGRQSPEQLRENLMKMLDFVSKSKTRIVNAYQQQYAPPAASGGAVPATKVEPGAESMPVPAAYANELDGTILNNAKGTWKKQGDKLVLQGK